MDGSQENCYTVQYIGQLCQTTMLTQNANGRKTERGWVWSFWKDLQGIKYVNKEKVAPHTLTSNSSFSICTTIWPQSFPSLHNFNYLEISQQSILRFQSKRLFCSSQWLQDESTSLGKRHQSRMSFLPYLPSCTFFLGIQKSAHRKLPANNNVKAPKRASPFWLPCALTLIVNQLCSTLSWLYVDYRFTLAWSKEQASLIQGVN